MSTQTGIADLRRFPAGRGHREHPCKPREDLHDRKLVREVDYS